MSRSIHIGCGAGLGHGGLGFHFAFVYRAAESFGMTPTAYSRHSDSTRRVTPIPSPYWSRWLHYTPLRWSPSTQVLLDSTSFDTKVAERLPREPIVYHSFPGYAKTSFQRVREYGGTTVLEAATVHVNDLMAATSAEHQKFHMGGNPFSEAWKERVLREYEIADYISVSSSLQASSFLRRNIPAKKIIYAPLGVDLNRYHAHVTRERRRTDKFRIIQVGQISLLKGFPYLLEALQLLNDSEIELTLFGGIGWRAIRQLIEKYRASGVNVRVAHGNPVLALQQAHLCVHASVSDGFGMAPLEAMAMAVPTMVTNRTGMRDLIEQDVNGIIVPNTSVCSLAHQIARLKDDEVHRQKLGNAARRTAEQYSLESSVIRYRNALKPVWEDERGPCKARA